MKRTEKQAVIAQVSSQSGFTIIELMIATMVFGIILLVITFGVIHFTNDYYKGINSSTTQTTSQNAIDTISQAIQFSSGGTTGTKVPDTGVFCAGTKMFLYKLGVQYAGVIPTSTSSAMGLYMINNPNISTCIASTLTSANLKGGTELLSNHTRLTAMSLMPITSTPGTVGVWQLSLSVVYGDDDLLCSPTVTGSCSSSTVLTPVQLQNADVTCRSQTGAQFCSVSALSTVVQQRIVN